MFKPFLDQTEEDLETSLEANVRGAFAFSQRAISTFKENEIDERGARGTLLFTGGIASVKADPFGTSISAGKSGLRALAQSLAKEFGKENIHVSGTSWSHCVGLILTKGCACHHRRMYEYNLMLGDVLLLIL